jgi:hypothetical protein
MSKLDLHIVHFSSEFIPVLVGLHFKVVGCKIRISYGGIYVQDNKDLYAEEAAVQREAERRRMLSIPGLIAPVELQDEMIDT